MSDIFVSYAHIDNQPFHEGKVGWISQFVAHLKNETSRRMGRNEHYSLWMDFRLNGNDSVTPEIEKQLREAKILLVMMSKGWLESEWCVKELEYFCKVNNDVGGRIFLIDQDGLPRDEKTAQTQDLLTYPFYETTPQQQIRQLGYPFPQPEHQAYFDRIVDLSYQLADAIRTPAAVASTAVTNTPTVYVAPVNDGLFDQRNTLISELDQYGIQVLPQHNRHESDMDGTLVHCSHFIQLLDDNYAQGIPFTQYFMAEGSGKPVLQWRDPALDPEAPNPEQQELLNGKTVRACALSEFIRQVRETVLPKPTPPAPETTGQHNGGKLVFVQSCPKDFERARQVAQHLQTEGFGTVLSHYEGDVERIRKNLQRAYKLCDILLILQQRGSADLVEDYLAKATVYAEKSPLVLLCQCPQAEELFFTPAGVTPLPCAGDFETDCLQQFLEVTV